VVGGVDLVFVADIEDFDVAVVSNFVILVQLVQERSAEIVAGVANN